MEHLLVEDLDFRCEMDSDDPAQSIEIDQLGYTAELDSRTETVNTAIASGTSSKVVTFQHAFFTGTSELGGSTSAFLPNIGITIENASAGDFSLYPAFLVQDLR